MLNDVMTLRQLIYFVKIVEAGSITRAAAQLNIAQTALGLQIRKLEESLQLKLLDRHPRGVIATPAGRVLYERSGEILHRFGTLDRDLTARYGRKRRIRLGVSPSILKLVGAELLLTSRVALPDIDLVIVEDLSFALADALERGELDYVLTHDLSENPALCRISLLEEDLLFVSAPKGRMAEGEVSFRKAVSGDLALICDRDIIWRRVQETAARMSLDVHIAYQVQSHEAIKALVRRGVARSIMPYGAVADEVRAGAIIARPITRPLLRRTLQLSHLNRAGPQHETRFRAFIDLMVIRLMGEVQPYASPIDKLLADANRPAPDVGAGRLS